MKNIAIVQTTHNHQSKRSTENVRDSSWEIRRTIFIYSFMYSISIYLSIPSLYLFLFVYSFIYLSTVSMKNVNISSQANSSFTDDYPIMDNGTWKWKHLNLKFGAFYHVLEKFTDHCTPGFFLGLIIHRYILIAKPHLSSTYCTRCKTLSFVLIITVISAFFSSTEFLRKNFHFNRISSVEKTVQKTYHHSSIDEHVEEKVFNYIDLGFIALLYPGSAILGCFLVKAMNGELQKMIVFLQSNDGNQVNFQSRIRGYRKIKILNVCLVINFTLFGSIHAARHTAERILEAEYEGFEREIIDQQLFSLFSLSLQSVASLEFVILPIQVAILQPNFVKGLLWIKKFASDAIFKKCRN